MLVRRAIVRRLHEERGDLGPCTLDRSCGLIRVLGADVVLPGGRGAGAPIDGVRASIFSTPPATEAFLRPLAVVVASRAIRVARTGAPRLSATIGPVLVPVGGRRLRALLRCSLARNPVAPAQPGNRRLKKRDVSRSCGRKESWTRTISRLPHSRREVPLETRQFLQSVRVLGDARLQTSGFLGGGAPR